MNHVNLIENRILHDLAEEFWSAYYRLRNWLTEQ